jgi:aspartyl-tRNA(Asn)/glutamyl-tRNA(Gln) amidotransferase subunit C
MGIDAKTIAWVAGLARLRLSPEEERLMEAQLDKILAYMDILGELDLEAVPPTAHTLGYTNVAREDTIRDSFDIAVVRALAPEWKDDHVVVPRIV